MPSSDDGLRVPEELVPPVDKKYGSSIVAAIKEAMADPVRRAQIEKNAAEAKEETNQEIEAEALAMQQISLTCIQCRLDGTVPFKTQNLVYTHSQLNKHLKSNFHTRREQVRRAFNIDKNDKGQCECPCCPAEDGGKMYLQEAFLAHM